MNEHPEQNENLSHAEATCAPAVAEPNYDAFGAWMDVELEKLVARWIHLAAPNASRPSRRARISK